MADRVYWGCTTFGCDLGFNGTEQDMPRFRTHCPSCGGALAEITQRRDAPVLVGRAADLLALRADRFGERSWCPSCSREVVPFDGACVACGSPVEELGTGDDDPYPGETA